MDTKLEPPSLDRKGSDVTSSSSRSDIAEIKTDLSKSTLPVIGSEFQAEVGVMRKCDFGFLPIPPHRRQKVKGDWHEQFNFTLKMNILLAIIAGSAVMNNFLMQPMQAQVALELGVPRTAVSNVPALVQGGYGAGILFISSLGDLVRRRPLVILLLFLTSTLNVGLARAQNVETLEGMSFLVGFFNASPQIVIPWAADLAPSNIRGRAISITYAGLITGVLFGRVFGGVMATYQSWRGAYWIAVGLQGFMVFLSWLCLPDTPKKEIGVSYPALLWSMAKCLVKYPTLVQACLTAFFMNMVFAGIFTAVTFLLSDAPYHYTAFQIGLFGLTGILGLIAVPLWGLMTDAIYPWLAQFAGMTIFMIGMVIALLGGDQYVSCVIVGLLLLYIGNPMYQVSAGYRVAGLDPNARARLNGCWLVFTFLGQPSGTALFSHIYNSQGGWKPTAGTAVALMGAAMICQLARGPHETGWLGWTGGGQVFKRRKLTDLRPEAVTEGPMYSESLEDIVDVNNTRGSEKSERDGEKTAVPIPQSQSGPTGV